MIPTRTPQIDMEEIVKNVGGSRFDLVIYGAALARSIAKKTKGNVKYINPVSTALLEIQHQTYDKKENDTH